MSDDFTADLLKTDIGTGELQPGEVKRRWEPDVGINKHREKIHRESRYADEHKDLPFTFSKPPKKKQKAVVKCNNCNNVLSATVNTVGIICRSCNKYSSVEVIA